MAVYLRSAHALLKSFIGYNIVQAPQVNNTYANAIAHLASTKEIDLLGLIPVEHLAQPGIAEEEINKLGPDKLTTSELAPNDHNRTSLHAAMTTRSHSASSPSEVRST